MWSSPTVHRLKSSSEPVTDVERHDSGMRMGAKTFLEERRKRIELLIGDALLARDPDDLFLHACNRMTGGVTR